MSNPAALLHPLAVERANKEPLPGALAVAFGPLDIVVGDKVVRPVVGGDYTIIKLINSPIYRQILEASKENGGEDIISTDYEQWDVIYLLTHPPLECHKLLSKGVEKYRDAAIEYCYSIPLTDIAALFLACVEQFKRNMTTMLQYGSKPEGKEGEVNFTQATVEKPKTD